MQRTCSVCGAKKALSKFRVLKKPVPKAPVTLRVCKKCEVAKAQARRKSTPEIQDQHRESNRKYRASERGQARSREYRARYLATPAGKRSAARNHIQQVARRRQLRREDLVYAFKTRIRKRLQRWFRSKKHQGGKAFSLLPYNAFELTDYLSKWLGKPCTTCTGPSLLTVDNCHIDHIFPICRAVTIEEVVELNQLGNLRLTCGLCNRRKSSKVLEPVAQWQSTGL